jgi:hypothetical protein
MQEVPEGDRTSIDFNLHNYYFEEYQALFKLAKNHPDQAFYHMALGGILVNLENYPLA